MLVKAFFEQALNWVQREFPRQGFAYEDIILELTSNQNGFSTYLPEEGVLSDIPVERNDIVSICLPDERPMNVNHMQAAQHPSDSLQRASHTDGGQSQGQPFII